MSPMHAHSPASVARAGRLTRASAATLPPPSAVNLVLEFIPETVYKITRQHTKVRQLPPLICVKL